MKEILNGIYEKIEDTKSDWEQKKLYFEEKEKMNKEQKAASSFGAPSLANTEVKKITIRPSGTSSQGNGSEGSGPRVMKLGESVKSIEPSKVQEANGTSQEKTNGGSGSPNKKRIPGELSQKDQADLAQNEKEKLDNVVQFNGDGEILKKVRPETH